MEKQWNKDNTNLWHVCVLNFVNINVKMWTQWINKWYCERNKKMWKPFRMWSESLFAFFLFFSDSTCVFFTTFPLSRKCSTYKFFKKPDIIFNSKPQDNEFVGFFPYLLLTLLISTWYRTPHSTLKFILTNLIRWILRWSFHMTRLSKDMLESWVLEEKRGEVNVLYLKGDLQCCL